MLFILFSLPKMFWQIFGLIFFNTLTNKLFSKLLKINASSKLVAKYPFIFPWNVIYIFPISNFSCFKSSNLFELSLNFIIVLLVVSLQLKSEICLKFSFSSSFLFISRSVIINAGTLSSLISSW
ncbi:hypothetical protein D3C87_1743010 [compost metagenome]